MRLSRRGQLMNPFAILHPGQELPDIAAQARVLQVRGYLAQRNQHESSAVKLRVRNRQLGSFQNHIIEKKDVQIDDPVRPANRAGPAAHLPFEGLTILQQDRRLQARVNGHDSVDVPFRARRPPRFGNEPGRDLAYVGLGHPPDLPDGAAAVVLLLPLIRAHSDVGAMLHGYYRLSCWSRSTASRRRSAGEHRVIRMKPSPGSPKPLPGVVTMPASSRSRAVKSVEVQPPGTGSQT